MAIHVSYFGMVIYACLRLRMTINVSYFVRLFVYQMVHQILYEISDAHDDKPQLVIPEAPSIIHEYDT